MMMTIVRRSSLAQRTGAALLLLLVVFAFVLPLLWPQDPVRQKLMLALQWPDLSAPFGYDHLGRSLFARLTAAIRLSLGLAFVSVLSAMIPGILLGVLAAWRGVWWIVASHCWPMRFWRCPACCWCCCSPRWCLTRP
ncbi:hypothetical protein ERHA55_19040 [Erwinia rhapontici]|nr:hypothetical protein ERHA55_19040 [Erwinia rhapontici]